MLLATLGALALALQQDPSADFFGKIEGEWTVRGTFEGNSEITGSETVEGRMDGRWVVFEHKLDYGGRPYRGFCLMTYDAGKGTYSGTWLDDRSTAPGAFEGKADGKTLTMRATSPAPETRGLQLTRWVFEQGEGDRRTVRVFGCEKDGRERQIAELQYTRRSVAK